MDRRDKDDPVELTNPAKPASIPSDSPGLPPSSSSGETTIAASASPGRFTLGQILGNRYRITALLGRGGMGEVWQAYDLKLQVDVALKSIRPERFPGEQGLELLRKEVRSAREVMSPNVCRIFDLVVEEGQEYVSMEWVDGETLLDVLRNRGPLDLQEATRLASQFLAGLEAIHQAGLVHRDVKPENIMITRTGRVVLMDFGIAKGIAEGHRGTIAGTPAYMAPEQSRGEALDARADIFAAGVVLAEMIAPAGVREHKTRESIWQSVRKVPVRLFESPWRGVLERAVAGERSERHGSARELARALEEVTLRVEGAEDKHPYPGLQSFTEADAEFFFGREVEVETVWKKLRRANLLAMIGPSGAGKTSFLQAGLLPARPVEWQYLLLRPGSSPFVALAQTLVPHFVGDAEVIQQLMQAARIEPLVAVLGRWREKYPQVLIVVDQFEELFTLCPAEVQASFADLLGRLAIEYDMHVLLVMRDDFLIRCHEHAQLQPIFSELTPLTPPTGSALRRALVQPALLCGYRLEDESLADEMLGTIEGERGALPMLAFAAARLWEHRDRERGLLTREAYERIGGVSGALAQHAEATLERIGAERQPLVREIFRNLVTAQGTRAVTEVEELLSVFDDRQAAGEVLRELVNARLLTSFELPERSEGEGVRHRIEIVHESLLSSWPRLVHWQTQDTEGAQLRDQLRQAAQLWKERHESEDLLWTGTAFREFELWRERYPGGLTATEEAFAKAMTSRDRRRRRRRRIALTTAFALLSSVIVAIGWSWRGEKAARLSAEATKLLALGRAELDAEPSAALAYAIASLELADNPTGRQFALEALSRGPAAMDTRFSGYSQYFLDFSPDGKWLAVGGTAGVCVIPRDGSSPVVLSDKVTPSFAMQKPQFAPDGDRVVFTSNDDPTIVRVWSLSKGREVRAFPMEGVTLPLVRGDRLFLITDVAGPSEGIGTVIIPAVANEYTGQWTRTVVRTWGFDEEAPQLIARWSPDGIADFDIDRRGRWVAYPKGRGVYLRPMDALDTGHEQLVGEHAAEVGRIRFDPEGERLATSDASGEIRLWALTEDAKAPFRVIPGKDPLCGLWFSPSGGMLAAAYASADKNVRLWDLNGPQDADPVVLRRREPSLNPAVAFDPSGQWIAVAYMKSIGFWPLAHSNPYVLHGSGAFGSRVVAFTPDGEWLAAAFYQGGIRMWNLEGEPTRDLWKPQSGLECFAFDPLGRFLIAGTRDDGVYRVSLQDGQARRLDTGWFLYVAVSPDGRRAAGMGYEGQVPRMRAWNLESGTSQVLEHSPGENVEFTADGRLLSVHWNTGEIRQWNLEDGSSTVLARAHPNTTSLAATRDGRFLYTASALDSTVTSAEWTYELKQYDLKNGTSRAITTHGNRSGYFTLDPAEALLVTVGLDGVTRVGPITGEEPHLLQAAGLRFPLSVAVSPDGHWIASADNLEPIVYLWRQPEGKPLQLLPREGFLNRLRALTFLRVAADKTSPSGYRLDPSPFPGWEKVPTW